MCVLYRTAFRCVRFLGAEFVCAVYRSALSTNGFYHFVKPFLTILWLRRALFCMYEYVRKSVYLLLCVSRAIPFLEKCVGSNLNIYISTQSETRLFTTSSILWVVQYSISRYTFLRENTFLKAARQYHTSQYILPLILKVNAMTTTRTRRVQQIVVNNF